MDFTTLERSFSAPSLSHGSLSIYAAHTSLCVSATVTHTEPSRHCCSRKAAGSSICILRNSSSFDISVTSSLAFSSPSTSCRPHKSRLENRLSRTSKQGSVTNKRKLHRSVDGHGMRACASEEFRASDDHLHSPCQGDHLHIKNWSSDMSPGDSSSGFGGNYGFGEIHDKGDLEAFFNSSTPSMHLTSSSVYSADLFEYPLLDEQLDNERTAWFFPNEDIRVSDCDEVAATADVRFHNLNANYGAASELQETMDGGAYTMAHYGPSGAVVCNAHGCRPIWKDEGSSSQLNHGYQYKDNLYRDNPVYRDVNSNLHQYAPASEPSHLSDLKDELTKGCFVGSMSFCCKPGPEKSFSRVEKESESQSQMSKAHIEEMEAFYQRELREDPASPLLLQNYAGFLYQVQGDYDQARKVYEKAALENPRDGELLVQYAKFLWEGMCCETEAALVFQRAVDASPGNCYVLGAHAAFIWDAESRTERSSFLAPPLLQSTEPVSLA